jgi:hypothetical protein
MRIVSGITFALFVLAGQGCSGATAPDTTSTQCAAGQHAVGASCAWNPAQVTLGPSATADGCPVFSPNPVSVHTNQLVEWTNNSSTSRTVYQFEGFNNGVPSNPLSTVAPGQTSGGVYWSSAGSISVFLSGCPSNSADWCTVIVTVN